jgi:conjugal transfer/entry exclusion protein
LRKLDYHSWRSIGPLFYQLDALLQEAETVTAATQDLEAVYYATFPGSTRYLAYQDEDYAQVQRALNTFRVSLLALQGIHQDTRGSLGTLGELQWQIDAAEGHQEALEAMAGLQSWQASQLSTIAQTLETLANTQIIASSYEINQAAQLRSTQTDTLAATLYRAGAAASASHESRSPFPAWMPQ